MTAIRAISRRRLKHILSEPGIADTAYFGPEAEFFIFDDIRYDSNEFSSYYYLDSAEGKWNSGRVENPNLGYKIRHKEGVLPGSSSGFY